MLGYADVRLRQLLPGKSPSLSQSLKSEYSPTRPATRAGVWYSPAGGQRDHVAFDTQHPPSLSQSLQSDSSPSTFISSAIALGSGSCSSSESEQYSTSIFDALARLLGPASEPRSVLHRRALLLERNRRVPVYERAEAHWVRHRRGGFRLLLSIKARKADAQ